MSTLYSVHFKHRANMVVAAATLLLCHPHHFNVRPDNINELQGLSTSALSCLHDQIDDDTLVTEFEGNMR